MNSSAQSFTISGRIRSIQHAIQGIFELLKSQHNARVHAFATLCVIVAGAYFGVSALEWCLLIIVITAVWVAEGLNTAFEALCDVVSPEFHPSVKKAKDVAAGAVLLCALGAVAVGLIIFMPYLLSYL
jgi:diacylglycerol kinase (ATP)